MPGPFANPYQTRPGTGALMGGAMNADGTLNGPPSIGSGAAPRMAGMSPRFAGMATMQPGSYSNPSFSGLPRANESPLMGSAKFGLQSAPVQSPMERQDQMTMGLIHQNVQLPPEAPATRLASQAGTPSGVSEQSLHQMYTTIQQQHPTLKPEDHAAIFNQTAARYGYNGTALLDKWGGQHIANTQDFPTGETTQTPATPGMPVSMLGPSNSAGNSIASRLPGMSAKEAGMSVGGLPAGRVTQVQGPMPGMTTPVGMNLAPSMATTQPTTQPSAPVLSTPGTNSPALNQNVANTNQSMANLQATRDAATTPVSADDTQRIADNNLLRVRAQGAAELANTPPTQREGFDAGTQLANAAVNQPVAVANAKGAAAQGVAQTTAAGRVAAATAKSTASRKEPATPQDQRVAVATTQLRSALEAHRATPNDPAAQQEVIKRAQLLDAAQKDREAGTAPPGATTQPGGPPAVNGDGSPDTLAGQEVQVIAPDGTRGSIPASNLAKAKAKGYREAK